jgi:hemerythrin
MEHGGMMSIEWSGTFSTGVEWQDRHHKELFKRINALLDAMNVGMGKEEVLRLFKFLDEYVVVHFDAEEREMYKTDYPGALAHIAEHTGFIEEIAELEDECRRKGVSTALVIKTQGKVVDWLLSHIGGSDKALGAHILKKRD